ncbi:hypothetical protein Mal4_39410 [Maioricimonas rarisocia]|uniref:Uncharacterized protein n=1 Tax=Maioricimonas rarisocia TaxID=2528026 RepID=A0A517ZAQ7_9PLAN|nr:hypothetical protein [Maioricimonas rarisocia]QDU39595.1 hypothetical protein Mal4_39410 [Maioricimonas rarisocia]
MASIDVLVESEYSDDFLSAAVATVLQISREEVVVIHDLSEYPHTDGSQVVCNVQRFDEGFSQSVSCDCQHDFDGDQFVRGIAAALKTRCLVPASDPNPYAMRLFTANGEVADVFVDASALDYKGVYIIA